MNSKILLSKASLADLPEVYNLVLGLAKFENESDAVVATIDDYVTGFKENLFFCEVAKIDEKIVGMTIYYLSFSTWRGKMMYLEDFYVHPEFRGKGIGHLLFESFLLDAKKQSCIMVKWQVLDWNKKAIDFYDKFNTVYDTNWYNGKIYF